MEEQNEILDMIMEYNLTLGYLCKKYESSEYCI